MRARLTVQLALTERTLQQPVWRIALRVLLAPTTQFRGRVSAVHVLLVRLPRQVARSTARFAVQARTRQSQACPTAPRAPWACIALLVVKPTALPVLQAGSRRRLARSTVPRAQPAPTRLLLALPTALPAPLAHMRQRRVAPTALHALLVVIRRKQALPTAPRVLQACSRRLQAVLAATRVLQVPTLLSLVSRPVHTALSACTHRLRDQPTVLLVFLAFFQL